MPVIQAESSEEVLKKKLVFKGVPAVIVLLLYGVYMTMGYVNLHSSFDDQGHEAVLSYIQSDYSREPIEHLRQNIKQDTRQDRLEAMSKEVRQLSEVEIVSVELRGIDSDDLSAKVEIEVDGRTPPDGRRFRYFDVQYSWLTGWRVDRETNANLYKLRF